VFVFYSRTGNAYMYKAQVQMSSRYIMSSGVWHFLMN